MKIVYICHPIGGDIPNNIKKILAIVRDINLKMWDIVPFAPYIADVLALEDDKPDERARGFRNNMAILRSGIVNELWIYGKQISKGMKEEIEMAYMRGIPILVMDSETYIPIPMRMIMNKGY